MVVMAKQRTLADFFHKKQKDPQPEPQSQPEPEPEVKHVEKQTVTVSDARGNAPTTSTAVCAVVETNTTRRDQESQLVQERGNHSKQLQDEQREHEKDKEEKKKKKKSTSGWGDADFQTPRKGQKRKQTDLFSLMRRPVPGQGQGQGQGQGKSALGRRSLTLRPAGTSASLHDAKEGEPRPGSRSEFPAPENLWTPTEARANWGALIREKSRDFNGKVFPCYKAYGYQYQNAFRDKNYPSAGSHRYLDRFRPTSTWFGSTESTASRKTPLSSRSADLYHKNMQVIVKESLSLFSSLLHSEEKDLLNEFLSLDKQAQMIFASIFALDCGMWRDLSELITDLPWSELLQCGKVLEKKGFIETSLPLTSDFILGKWKELSPASMERIKSIACLDYVGRPEGGVCPPEEQVLTELREKSRRSLVEEEDLEFLKECLGASAKCGAKASALFCLIHTLVLSSSGYSAEEAYQILNCDLNGVIFPVKTGTSHAVFAERADLDSYVVALALHDSMEAALVRGNGEWAYNVLHYASSKLMELQQPDGQTSPEWRFRFSEAHALFNVCLRGVSLLERERKYSEALHYLQILLGIPSETIPSVMKNEVRIRYAVDCEHLGCKEEALRIYEEALALENSSTQHAMRLKIEQGYSRLATPPRRWRPLSFPPIQVAKQIKMKGVPGESRGWVLEEANKSSNVSVEQYVLQAHYHKHGYTDGAHCENGLWLSLFALLMWDTIYDTSVGVFPTTLCDFPLNLLSLYQDSTSRLRKEIDILKSLSGTAIRDKVKQTYMAKKDFQCKGFNSNYSLGFLCSIAKATGGAALAAVFESIIVNGDNFGGMPDLVAVRGDCAFRGGSKVVFAEVKGPGDSLSVKQKASIHLLIANGANVELVFVDKKKGKNA